MHAVIPIKGFTHGKGRLAESITPTCRSELNKATAGHVLDACEAAGFSSTIVTGDPEAMTWAEHRGAQVVPDPAQGLDAACKAGVAARPDPWVVVHADLPLLDEETMTAVCRSLAKGLPVIAPARDGGTNILGHISPIAFAYGPGSFHRHLSRLDSRPLVLTTPGSLFEIDTIEDLAATAHLPGGEWLRRFLS